MLTFLFELTGSLALYRQLAGDPGQVSAGQRALALATPTWVDAAFAVAVGVGLLGAVMLLFRRKEASIALFVSLAAVAVQMSGGLMMPATLNQFNLGQIVPPVAVFALSYLVWQLSLIARNRGWLR